MNKMDEQFFAKVADFLNEMDRFGKFNNMKIVKISEGYSEAILEVDEKHLNGLNIVQGGAMYTLADLAFAGAINSFGLKSVGMSSSSSFVRPGSGKLIKAIAKVVNKGRQTAVFDVDVFNENGKLLVHSTFTGFISDKPFFD